jgi:hypothetical protein
MGKVKEKEQSKQPENEFKTNKDEWERVSAIVKKGLLDKVRSIAYWERKEIKDVLSEAIENFIQLYGEVKPIPEKHTPVIDPAKLKHTITTSRED